MKPTVSRLCHYYFIICNQLCTQSLWPNHTQNALKRHRRTVEFYPIHVHCAVGCGCHSFILSKIGFRFDLVVLSKFNYFIRLWSTVVLATIRSSSCWACFKFHIVSRDTVPFDRKRWGEIEYIFHSFFGACSMFHIRKQIQRLLLSNAADWPEIQNWKWISLCSGCFWMFCIRFDRYRLGLLG